MLILIICGWTNYNISTLYVFECKFYYLKIGYYIHEILYVICVVTTKKIEKVNILKDKETDYHMLQNNKNRTKTEGKKKEKRN